jgi:pimeloyl-ACP methyl ester carboxylesterase
MSLLFFESEGNRLAYTDTGSGLPVLFLHPTPLDHGFWAPLIARLSGIRAIAPDMRGHGASELGADLQVGLFDLAPQVPVLNAARMASDVIALLDHLHIEKAVIVACSFGGYTALELWRRIPRRILGLGFLCSRPQPEPEPFRQHRAEAMAQATASNLGEIFDGAISKCTGLTAQTVRPEILRELRACVKQPIAAYLATQAGLATRPDSVPTVATINVPLLAVSGGEDNASSRADMLAFLNTSGPRVDYTFLSEAGHFAAYEYPDTVAAIVQPWLGRFA